MNSPKARAHLSNDRILQNIMPTTKILKLPNSGNVFNELIKAIVYQQISYKAADSIFDRFLKLIKTENYKPFHVLRCSHEELRSIGFSNQKAAYVINISNFFKENRLYGHDWSKLSDNEIIHLLTQIKGVGSWTAQMILIFELKRKDVFPDGDLAVQLVMKELYELKSEKRQLITDMNEIAENWRPYRTIASLYLWAWRRDNYK